MDISITAVTKNRPFSKALTRLDARIELLRACAGDIGTDDELFDIFQMVFTDHEDDYIEVIGTKKKDRLFQVKVGIPSGIPFNPDGDARLAKEIERRLLNAIEYSSLRNEKKAIIKERLK